MASVFQDGLAWEQTTFELVPVWTRNPSTTAIESVCRKQLRIATADPCTITFHEGGLFNKVYLVESFQQTFVMRVTLPVYPRYKTQAEVTTLQWVREHTSIPVPSIFGFDDSNDNEIGFEWILMEFMRGTSARKRWRTMSMEQKTTLTQLIAKFHFELSGLNRPRPAFKGIGSLKGPTSNVASDVSTSVNAPSPGRLVSYELSMGDHLNYDVPRGPFSTTHDWLNALLHIIIRHQKLILETSKDEDDREDAEEILPVAEKLLRLLPKVFPPGETTPETTALQHHDLHLNNILVDDKGQVTGVIDWECVSALPLWMLSQVP